MTGDAHLTRNSYFSQYIPTGMLEPGSNPEHGIFNKSQSASDHSGIGAGDLPPSDLEVETLINSHTTPEYLSFLTHTDLRSFVRRLMGWDREVLLQRTMLRHNAPGGKSTAVHYDKLFLRGGAAYFLTAWVPLGDTAQNGGGLMYLADSTGLGREIEDEFTRRAAESLTDEERISAFNVNMEKNGMLSHNAGDFAAEYGRGQKTGGWLVANYEAGDVVFHDPYMIHTSTVNEDVEGRIRLSTDLRFYKEGSDMDMRWMKFWTPGDGL